MKYSLLITCGICQQGADTALRFAKALISKQHQIYRIFFYQDGVTIGNQLSSPPSDELAITANWSYFASEHNIELQLCVASALRRGVIGETEAERFEKSHYNLADNFHIVGLGQWADAVANSDRITTFK